MAFLYGRSKTWRRIVDTATRSTGNMLLFVAVCGGVPYIVGDQVMKRTNQYAAKEESDLEQKLRSRGGLDAKILAQAQRDRLQVMLTEIKGGGSDSEARYKAALDGQSLGTHSRGSSVGARAIHQQQPAAAAGGAAASGKSTSS
ncbi:hypothetical protein D9Q98_005485 [Chlorella vulgaris]|uniref:Uncharacterized protein n=1 Tax=Chlorella vulgaris TaxID=3077 RepID=A0A9D4TMS9_CHLVU|nr:hypothetical protein D9Q98_005485 [Chlorella vulgaris]